MQSSINAANIESPGFVPNGTSATTSGPPTSFWKYDERFFNSVSLTFSTKNIAYGLGVVVAEQATVDETSEELTFDGVVFDEVAFEIVDCEEDTSGVVWGASSGSGSGSSGFGCVSSGIGLPEGPITNGGRPHEGGKLNTDPQPKIDLNIEAMPDPHLLLFGSLGFPPSPKTTMPWWSPPQIEHP